jgi:hypothetical protein
MHASITSGLAGSIAIDVQPVERFAPCSIC